MFEIYAWKKYLYHFIVAKKLYVSLLLSHHLRTKAKNLSDLRPKDGASLRGSICWYRKHILIAFHVCQIGCLIIALFEQTNCSTHSDIITARCVS
jgi:hypothetical protein